MIRLEGNFFWFGVVEDVDDPWQQGRVRVRVIGIHTEDTELIPTDALPWCHVMRSTASASISGVGLTPVGMVPGTMVAGIFKDPESMQEPIVFFTYGAMRMQHMNPTFGFNDPQGHYPVPQYTQDINERAIGRTDELDTREADVTDVNISSYTNDSFTSVRYDT